MEIEALAIAESRGYLVVLLDEMKMPIPKEMNSREFQYS